MDSLQELKLAKDFLIHDDVLRPVIEKYELTSSVMSTRLFYDVLESIVSQQLSIKAADTIFKRFLALLPEQFTPEDVYALTHEQLRSVGLSNNKAIYVHALAHEVVMNAFEMDTLHQVSDEEVIVQLTRIKGIGRWTAEMMLIFALGRPDVFSVGDLGLRAAVEKLYGIERTKLKEIEELSQQWKPYRSYASRWLWKSLDNK